MLYIAIFGLNFTLYIAIFGFNFILRGNINAIFWNLSENNPSWYCLYLCQIIKVSNKNFEFLSEKNYAATLYGAYKVCDENIAYLYYQDWGVPSIGIRPGIVYGVGRDQGITSKTTIALLAAAAKKSYTIPFSGPISALYAGEVASALIKIVSKDRNSSPVFDMNGSFTTVEEWVNILLKIQPNAKINFTGKSLPFPFDLPDKPLRDYIGDYNKVDLNKGIQDTFNRFKDLLFCGKIFFE